MRYIMLFGPIHVERGMIWWPHHFELEKEEHLKKYIAAFLNNNITSLYVLTTGEPPKLQFKVVEYTPDLLDKPQAAILESGYVDFHICEIANPSNKIH